MDTRFEKLGALSLEQVESLESVAFDIHKLLNDLVLNKSLGRTYPVEQNYQELPEEAKSTLDFLIDYLNKTEMFHGMV